MLEHYGWTLKSTASANVVGAKKRKSH